MKKKLILLLLATNTLSLFSSQKKFVVLVLPKDFVVTKVTFKNPPATPLSGEAPIYFFTSSRISDTDEVVSLLSDTSTQEEQRRLENIITTFAPARENFAVDAQRQTATLLVESKSRVLTREQLLGFIKPECQKQNLKNFLEKNAQIIVTEETLAQLVKILRK